MCYTIEKHAFRVLIEYWINVNSLNNTITISNLVHWHGGATVTFIVFSLIIKCVCVVQLHNILQYLMTTLESVYIILFDSVFDSTF